MKVLNVIFIVLFVLSAAVQYNDPDPFVWMAIYLYGAVMCFLALKRRYMPALFIAGIACYLIYAAYLFFADDGVFDWASKHNGESIVNEMQATRPWIEQTREFFGLLILVAALTADLLWLSKVKKHLPENRVTATP
jgi:hypothetical protein